MHNILIFLVTIGFSSVIVAEDCECNKETILSNSAAVAYEKVPKYKHGEPYYFQEHRLFRSYLDDSGEQLEDFFHAWKDSSVGISKRELKSAPPVISSAYKIFEDFYQPKNLSRIGKPEWGTDQFKSVKYFIVQKDLNVVIAKKLKENISLSDSPPILDITINNFRPNLKGDTPALFLTDTYQRVLESFLGSEELPVGHGGLMNPSVAKGESEKRQKYLNSQLKIYHGHWGGWRYVTDPTVTSIVFNKSLNKAIVRFSLVYEGGHAIYRFKKGKWILQESRLTWIS